LPHLKGILHGARFLPNLFLSATAADIEANRSYNRFDGYYCDIVGAAAACTSRAPRKRRVLLA
jgi:hypothetical protein